MTKLGHLVVLLLVLLTAACSQEEATSTAVAESTATVELIPTPTRTPTTVPEPTPTPEPDVPSIETVDQSIDDQGQLSIPSVRALESSWLVIRADEDGQPGNVIAYVAVPAGEQSDIAVSVDPFRVTPRLYAALYDNAAESDVFEPAELAEPLSLASGRSIVPFEIDIQIQKPVVTAGDQVVADDGLVIIDQVYNPGPGWVALHNDDTGSPGQMLGYYPIQTGLNENVPIKINWHEATPIVHAVLYHDKEASGHFDSREIDPPVLVDNEPVIATFNIRMPLELCVLDQPVIDGIIYVERVVSYGPGWIVVYQDDEGQLGNIIGWAQLADGVNELIEIPVNESAVTPLLNFVLHEDLEEVGEFGFPRTDPPVRFQDRLPNPVVIRTDSGNFIITTNQPLTDSNEIVVPLVVVDQNAWTVIHRDEEGQAGEIIGRSRVPAGFNRDVVVELEPELVTEVLHATLYLDAGTPRIFDYPDGLDIPMQRNRAVISAPFEIIE